jgi:hypothetical protein
MNLPGMRRRAGAARVAAVATCAALTLAACSSGGGKSGGSSSNGATTTTGSAPTSSSNTGTGPADAATTAAVKNAYAKFFSPNTPENVSLGLLQDGPKFKAAIDQQASGSMAASASVQVSSVSLISPKTAKVSFTIYLNKQPMLKNQPGYAVNTNGTWQVAAYTFCGLLTLEGSAPAACKEPAAATAPK